MAMYSPREIPRLQILARLALPLRPRLPIRQRTKVPKRVQHHQDEHHRDLHPPRRLEVLGEQVKDRAEAEDGKVEGGEVVVEEELTLHEVEGEVVECPGGDEEAADLVVGLHRSCRRRR